MLFVRDGHRDIRVPSFRIDETEVTGVNDIETPPKEMLLFISYEKKNKYLYI